MIIYLSLIKKVLATIDTTRFTRMMSQIVEKRQFAIPDDDKIIVDPTFVNLLSKNVPNMMHSNI